MSNRQRTAMVARLHRREQVGPRRHRGRGQLRQQPHPGPLLLRERPGGRPVPGLMHVNLGGYHVRDIEFVAAFDVDANKVGKDLSEAIYAEPNNTFRFHGCAAHRRHGRAWPDPRRHSASTVAAVVPESLAPAVDVVRILRSARSTCSSPTCPWAARTPRSWYAEQAIKAGVGFVNAIPVFIGREPYWQRGSPTRACPSSVTTSRARSAPPSPTA